TTLGTSVLLIISRILFHFVQDAPIFFALMSEDNVEDLLQNILKRKSIHDYMRKEIPKHNLLPLTSLEFFFRLFPAHLTSAPFSNLVGAGWFNKYYDGVDVGRLQKANSSIINHIEHAVLTLNHDVLYSTDCQSIKVIVQIQELNQFTVSFIFSHAIFGDEMEISSIDLST
ncbi:hypothetical protein PFISCL1PPCAC_26219, partial [Pristionchus fissidentatus]